MHPQNLNPNKFIPTTLAEMIERGWKQLDVLFISGDAYIDHPAFGIPLLARWLEAKGIKVGIIAQPNINTPSDFLKMGIPRLFVGVSSGTVDSMLNNYTANKKTRSDDMYSEGGLGGKRPDYASLKYCEVASKVFPDTPIVAGGVEVSLRRLAHYDYWQNKVFPSIVADIKADLVAFGMGEQSVLDLCTIFAESAKKNQGIMSKTHYSYGMALEKIQKCRGFAYLTTKEQARLLENKLTLPSFEEVKNDKKKFARAALLIEREANPYSGKKLVQYHGNNAIVINEPPLPLTTPELDSLYALPFLKAPHSSYTQKIPAFEMIQFSMAATRGCYGGCTFCAITLHQGRIVQSRSTESILSELEKITAMPKFTGHISDIGGPTANMYGTHCKSPHIQSVCKKMSCLFPSPCPHLICSHKPQIQMLEKCRAVPKVKSIRIGSGIRYDLCFADKQYGEKYLQDVITHHVGGQLKVAPEHLDESVLALMRKPKAELFEKFLQIFQKTSQKIGKEQYIVPYFISGFPGCTSTKMKVVHDYLCARNWNVQQVQAFIPTPMTLATAMYYTGIDPLSKQEIFVAKGYNERKVQQALLQPQKSQHKKYLNTKSSKANTYHTRNKP